jgi:hypothetical protein
MDLSRGLGDVYKRQMYDRICNLIKMFKKLLVGALQFILALGSE